MEMPTKNMFHLGRPCISQAEVTFSLNVNLVILIDLVRMFLRDKNMIPMGIKFEHINCRQFGTKMYQIAPNCVSNFIKFPGGNTPGSRSWGGEHPLPRPFPRPGASRLDSWPSVTRCQYRHFFMSNLSIGHM